MPADLSAIVVAAGRSSRFLDSLKDPGLSLHSKQLVEWNGRPLIIHTLEALFHLSFLEVVLVVPPSEIDRYSHLVKKYFSSAPILFSPGGKRRQDSVRQGLNALTLVHRVLVHDGARPFLDPKLLERLNEQSKSFEAVIPTLPLTETLKEVDSSGKVVRTYNRNQFVRVQTPQFFRFSLLREVHNTLKDNPMEFTDDAAMLEHCGYSVQTCEGSVDNTKITIFEDLRGIHVGF